MIRTLTLLSALLMLSACRTETPPAEPAPPRAVRVAGATQGPATPAVRASGVLTTRDEVSLAFKVGGVIRDIQVREGDAIVAGQVLAALESAEIDAGVAQAQAAYQKALRDLQRGRTLRNDEVIPQEALDDLATAEAVARAQLRAAEYNQGYAVITASADGRVLRRLAEPRQLVTAGTPVLRVSDHGSGRVLELGVPDRDFVRIAVGQKATLQFDALEDLQVSGEVIGVGQAADPRTGTFRVEVAISDDDPRLASGLIGQARIDVSRPGEQLSRVPLTALVEGTSAEVLLFTYAGDSGTVTARHNRVRFIEAGQAALEEPLPAGTRVVTEGAAYLRDGDTVRVIE